MVDYRRFLAKSETLVLPWLGGTRIDARERVVRLVGAAPPKPGWYAFEISGRNAKYAGPAETPDLSKLERVRGWLRGEVLFRERGAITRVQLLPDEEPPAFSPVTARRWSNTVLIFESLEFESEAEGACRAALAQGQAIDTVKGVAAPLRAAFGTALLERASDASGIPFVSHEVRQHLGDIAERGMAAAAEVLAALRAEREQAQRELAELERQRQAELLRLEVELQRQIAHAHEAEAAERLRGEIAHVRERMQRRWRPGDGVHLRRHQGDAEQRAEAALEAAGARLESIRRIHGNELEVVFFYSGERFISIVDGATLQVIDSGICLGHPPADELITLDSLPGVIQEAMETDRLVILRHA